MHLLGWEIRWRKRRCELAPPFLTALFRVRSLRERRQWAPLSNQPAIRRRDDRVRAIRKRVTSEGGQIPMVGDQPKQFPGQRWFGLAGPLPWPLLVVLLVCWVLMYRIVSTWPE
jgi:hypothetical protein